MSERGYEGPAILEVMGHQRHTGTIAEEKVAGVSMVRIDTVTADGGTQTKYFSSGAIYCITPTSAEEVQAKIDEARKAKRQRELTRAVGDAWRAAAGGTDPASMKWCANLMGSTIDEEATKAKRAAEDAETEPGRVPGPTWIILTDGTEMYYAVYLDAWLLPDW